MSAFVVDNAVIHRIISLLATRQMQGTTTNFAVSDKMQRQELGQRMINMNCLAMEELDGTDEDYQVYEYQHIEATRIEGLKAMHCWLYQCSEGDVPCTQLYGKIEKVARRIVMEIINEMPEYNAAPWG